MKLRYWDDYRRIVFGELSPCDVAGHNPKLPDGFYIQQKYAIGQCTKCKIGMLQNVATLEWKEGYPLGDDLVTSKSDQKSRPPRPLNHIE